MDGASSLAPPKAATTRCSVPLVRGYAVQVFNRGEAPDQDVVGILNGLTEFYEILYGGQLFLDDDEVARLRAVILDIGRRAMRLRAWGRHNNTFVFNVKPKWHKMQHLPMYASALNPRHVECYLEESLIGAICRIWHRAMRGNYMIDAQSNVLIRRTLGLLLRLEP